MLSGDVKAMNRYMNTVSLATFSYFDTAKNSFTENAPERFYHGFVLGLVVELMGRYKVNSNRESGYGRYDVMLEPLNSEDPAFILEFKAQDSDEKDLEKTVESALNQIKDKKYEGELIARGIEKERIRCYGFAFQGKRVLIG